MAAVAAEAWPTVAVVAGPGGRARSPFPRALRARLVWPQGRPVVAVAVGSAVLLRLQVVVAMPALDPEVVVGLEVEASGTLRVGCVGAAAADSWLARVHSVARTRRCRPLPRSPRRSRRSRRDVGTSDDGGSTELIMRSGRVSVGR